VPPLVRLRRAGRGDPVHVPRLPAPRLPLVASHRPLPGAPAAVRDGETGSVTDAALEVLALRVEFGGVHAVTGVSFSVPTREVTSKPAYARARLGLVRTFQLSSEFARLTVMENLLVAAPRQRATTFWGALLGKRYWRAQQAQLVESARGLLAEFDMSQMADE